MNALDQMAVRQWAFEKALLLKGDLDYVQDIIYKAAEIEAYVVSGANPMDDFQSSVEAALKEVEHAAIANVADAKKLKVVEEVRKWLKEYHAL